MNSEQAFVPQMILRRGNLVSQNVLSVAVGIAFISCLAQVSIPLSWTPVPITGQTFGVALTALMWGRKRALAIVFGYLMIGSLGLPVFAMGKSGFSFGPTSGYLLGMLAAAGVMGTLADRGWTHSFYRTWFAAFLGSLITFSFGLLVLSFFVPRQSVLTAGLFPFLPGDFIKTGLASFMASQCTHLTEKIE